MRIFLLRHASSLSNELGIWTGQRDSELSPRGIAMQENICARFEYPKGARYFSSPLKRCTESLALVYGRQPVRLIAEFSECALGALEGQPYTNLDNDVNYLAWLQDSGDALHGGESFRDFSARVRLGFLRMVRTAAEQNAESVVALLHGNVMRAILHAFVDPAIPHDAWQIPNCGGYRFEYGTGKEATSLAYEKLPDFLFD